jgi:methylenetetrahydrofolate dehydrogenase (NADP+)/methenyltetrahydrofolate cyclohydrolase
MAIIFDGREFALKKEEALQLRVIGLKSRGVYPKLASIIVGNDEASKLYVNLKKKAANRIGAELDIYYIPAKTKLEELLLLIATLNTDDTVYGIMIQMPLPGDLESKKAQIIGLINPEKDVDGLRSDSDYLHPTSKAVMDILHQAETEKEVKDVYRDGLKDKTIVVVGATGMVGAPLVKQLKNEGYRVVECNSSTTDLKSETLKGDVVISATGIQGLIKGDMVKENAVLIDVGSPKADFSPVAQDSAVFFTPVPGGVGPVTISCLLENLISAC